MKTSKDPRHKKRQEIIKILFAKSFKDQPLKEPTADKIFENLPKIDTIIKDIAPEFPIEKINRVDLAILRLGVYELMETSEPQKVIIDEAIELAKEFGGENSAGFINGALGKFIKEISKYGTSKI